MESGDLNRKSGSLISSFNWGTGGFGLVLFGFILVAFPDVLLAGKTFFYRDFSLFGYPLAHYHRDSFWRGELPLWNPYNQLGLPFLAQWNTLTLYPLSLIYLLLPLSWALGFFCLVHQFLAGLGMYRLARRWTGDRLAAAMAGLAFAFGGLAMSCIKWPNNMAALAWMPWVILLLERVRQDEKNAMRWAVLAGVCQMLTGAPEIILFTWLLAMALWLWQLHWLHATHAEPHRLPSLPRSQVRLVILILVVAGLSAVQLLPFFHLLMLSHRVPASETPYWSMPLWGWANLWVPLFRCFPSHHGVYAQFGQYWISSYYPGAVILALSIGALVWIRDIRVGVLGVITFLSLILAAGDQGRLYAWLSQVMPQIQFMRFPIKFIVLASFSLPLLAAFALARIRQRAEAQRTSALRPLAWLAAVWMVGGVTVLGMGYFYHLPSDDWPAVWRNGLSRAFFMIAGFGALLASANNYGGKSWLWQVIFVGLLGLDLLTHAPRLNPTVERWVYHPVSTEFKVHEVNLPQHGISRALISPGAKFRLSRLVFTNAVADCLASRKTLLANCNLLDQVPKVDGFYSLSLREEAQVRSLIYGTLPPATGFLNMLGVSQVLLADRLPKWTPRPGALPLITLGQTPVFATPRNTLLGLMQPDFDPLKVVYLPESIRGECKINAAGKGKILNAVFSAQRISFTAQLDQSCLMLIAQAYHPSWRARIDGEEVPLWRANHAFQALEVPAGKHQITLVYRDLYFLWGMGLSAATLIFCLAGKLLGWGRRL